MEPTKEAQNFTIEKLLNEVIAGLKEQNFDFTYETSIYGGRFYKHEVESLDLVINISGYFPKPEWDAVAPSFSVEIDLTKSLELGRMVLMKKVLTRIMETSELRQVRPDYANAIKSKNATAIVTEICRIKSRWVEFHSKMLDLIVKHDDDIEKLAEAASFAPMSAPTGSH